MTTAARTLFSAFALLVSSAAGAVVVTQTVEFPTIAPFGTFTTGNAVTGGWSANPFPLGSVGQINSIAFTFATDDPDFFIPGPGNGVPSVELGVLDDSMARIGLSSVNASILTATFSPGVPDPQMRFDKLAPLVLDGAFILSLGAFEDLGGSTAGMTLQDSRVTITLDFTPAAVPVPGTVGLLAAALGVLVVRRRVQAC